MEKNVNQNGTAGVSIVEIMISLVLVSLALIAVTTVFPKMMQHRKGIHEAEQAQILAEEALEYLQYYSCDLVNNGSGNTGFNATYGSGHPITIGAATYTVTKATATCANAANSISTVVVTVNWKKSGKDRKVRVTGVLR